MAISQRLTKDNNTCPDADLGALCDTDCRGAYIACRQNCNDLTCDNECAIEYVECLSDCPCGVNCPNGCEDCEHPTCQPSPCEIPEENKDFLRCKNSNEKMLNGCLSNCYSYDCSEICTQEFLENTKNCPCNPGCPQGCPFCPDYNCEIDDGFLAMTYFYSFSAPLEGNVERTQINYPIGNPLYITGSGYAYLQDTFYIFGGEYDRYMISKLDGYFYKIFFATEIKNGESHYYSNSVAVLSDDSKVLLCFTSDIDYKSCMYFDGSSVGLESSKTNSDHILGCIGNYREAIMAFGCDSTSRGKYAEIRDPETGDWSYTTNFPIDNIYTEGASCIGVGDAMLTIGGYGDLSQAIYLFKNESWNRLGNLSTYHYFGSVINFNDEIYALGAYAIEKFTVDTTNGTMSSSTIFYDYPPALEYEIYSPLVIRKSDSERQKELLI
ncbi:Oidioi.mRNA.OKI2018_I69.chr2.g8137.t1.cds [Oikopleura dioica]|uniref:Oidioi.mRNA.OKI2018_I69.chr2.g8137.t1.cds n=1 Tax=Oikopleura dioica TaxID=34765 RepID=A0ABN7TCU1_OIKDI|nr:Oidioi.mRNA.OKI2018_I69.chr2.g8137.t1.cds [Oikopleura dioica]